MIRIVADLGNSRLKWARVDRQGRPGGIHARPAGDAAPWADLAPLGDEPESWTIASVNPPAADRLASTLRDRGVEDVLWFRSAASVPIRHDLEYADTAGADRALSALGALARRDGRGPGLVVSCGTAVTIERISAGGIWQGGAITAGLGSMARGLDLATAQLPTVTPARAPEPYGRSTVPALEAGIFWGVVGAIRELLGRQGAGLDPAPWVVWTGGDAPTFAPLIDRAGLEAEVVPDLVLEALAGLAWSGP